MVNPVCFSKKKFIPPVPGIMISNRRYLPGNWAIPAVSLNWDAWGRIPLLIVPPVGGMAGRTGVLMPMPPVLVVLRQILQVRRIFLFTRCKVFRESEIMSPLFCNREGS